MTETLDLKEAEARLRDILRLTTADAVERNRLALALLRALREARTALQPFGSMADRFNESLPDDDSVAHIPHVALAFVNVTRGDFRRARAVLEGVRDG